MGPSGEQEHLCGSCVAGSGVTSCPKHGPDFIEYKCTFCCKKAAFFCWGSTHFCHDCHSRQMKGDYVSRLPLSQLPQCRGPAHCPLRCAHPPNGSKAPFALGCSLCRKNAQF